jgi:Rod binding domain-containing protein
VDITVGAVHPKAPAELTPDQKKALSRLHQVAQQWEGVFVNMLFKEMRKGESEQSVFGQKSPGEKIFGEMLDQEYSDSIAKSGSMGIGKILEHEMRSSVLANAKRESQTQINRGQL